MALLSSTILFCPFFCDVSARYIILFSLVTPSTIEDNLCKGVAMKEHKRRIFLYIFPCNQSRFDSCFCITILNHLAPPSELLEICELSLDKMGSVFEDNNVYMLHMMYQAMGVCLYMQDWDGALRYGQKIIKPYR